MSMIMSKTLSQYDFKKIFIWKNIWNNLDFKILLYQKHMNIIFILLLNLISSCHCSFVAYSTVLQRSPHYTHSLLTFQDIWIHMFLWAFASIFLVHALASTIALATLRKHKYGRFISVLILLYGTIAALVLSCVTSAVIAFVLYQAKIEVLLVHAMLCGFCQLGIFLFVTFFTLKPTL